MDKELDNLADSIINSGSSTPSPMPAGSASSPKPASRPTTTGDPFAARPATPRETFTAEVPRSEPVSPPAPEPPHEKSDEYTRIKEQMSAARENSNLPNVTPAIDQAPMPKKGLNVTILLFIIFIPVLVVSGGLLIALLNQPSGTDNNNSQSQNQPTYVDPRATATTINLSAATEEVKITEAGYYILEGTTTFPVKVNADDEVTLYLHNVSITATDSSAISNFSHHPLVIFLDDETESTLAVTEPATFDSIYSEGNLTIDGGTGTLNVSGIKVVDGYHYDVTGSGIKDSKSGTAIPTEPSENSTVETPAEGQSNLQEGTNPPAQPTDPSIDSGPAEN